MATVHTAYGPGKIVDQETVRGRTQYKVAGDGFEVWLDETKIASADGEDFHHALPGGWPGDDHHYAPLLEEEFQDHPLVENPGLARSYRDRRPDDTADFDDYYLQMHSSRREAWAPVDRSNSTTLPYNPDPQHNAIGELGEDGSATLQPIHHIDAEERLSPSNSLSFDEEGEGEEPGPNPDLFAKQSAMSREAFDLHQLITNTPWGQRVVDKILPQKDSDTIRGLGAGAAVGKAVDHLDNEVGRAVDMIGPGPGWGELIKGGSVHEANPAMALLPAALRALAPSAISGLLGGGGGEGPSVEDMGPGEGWGDLVKDAYYRPAGLSDRYIDITAGADYHNDPVAQFRHDPDAYINRIGQVMDEGLNPRFAEYMDLVEADSGVRTAAWKDVRKKAMRLKREGHVTVKDMAPNRIMASVVGDHGTYDVLILKSGSYGGLNTGGSSHSIANWHCGCEWGRWAFRRKFSYVGRLCSHAYASYLTMQSEHMKGKPRQPKRPTKAPRQDRAVTFPYIKGSLRQADNLQNGPQRLTPDLVVNDTDDAHMFMDVTKDERDDVGPDDVVSEKDIVHFARVMQACEAQERPYPRELVAFLARYAGCNDDSSDDTQADYEAHGATDANEYLEKIRSDADRKQEKDFGSMAERVHKIQDAVEEARAHGVDADRFVAMVQRLAAEDDDGVPKGYKKVPGGEPGTQLYRSENDPIGVQVGPGGDKREVSFEGKGSQGELYNKFEYDGDAYGAPGQMNQGVVDNFGGKAPSTDAPSAPTGGREPGWGGPAGKAPANTPEKAPAPYTDSPAAKSNTPGTAAGDADSGKGQTSGTIADGGVAGAENGNNAAITKTSPGVDADGNYTVGKGDTWSDIAQRTTGDMNNYQKMYDVNKGVAGGNIDSLAEGTKINVKDFLNDTGNGGMMGNQTNPGDGGTDKNMATPNAGPAVTPPAQAPVNTDAISGIGGVGGGADNTVTTPAAATTPTAPKQQEPVAQGIGKAGGRSLSSRIAAEGDGTTSNTSGQNGQTNTTAPTTDTAAPAAGVATTPPAPGVAATPVTSQPGGANSPGTGTRNPATPDTIGPSKESDTYDPNDPTQAQEGTGAGRNGGGTGEDPNSMGGLGGMDALSGIGDLASGLGSALPDIASGAMQAAPAIASGVGDLASGLMSGLGNFLGSKSIFSNQEDFNDFVRYAYPTADGEGDLEPHTHPFAGSGYPGSLDFETSEDYADKARKKMDDVTDLGDGDLTQSMGEWQKQSSYAEGTDDGSDIVRAFQANLGETALGAGAGGGQGRFDDFSGAAAGFLRTAGRNYSMAEQSELIREGDKGGARNLDSLDLSGTHYEDMHTLGW